MGYSGYYWEYGDCLSHTVSILWRDWRACVFEFLRLPLAKGSSTFTPRLSSSEGEDVTALRCSEPLRYKVGGPSKVFAMLCGMGLPGGYNR